jgi:hypothetical protein
MLITDGQNVDRLRGEAAFARMCAAAPIPASSGRTTRHRLDFVGDRAANRSLHLIAACRLRYDPRSCLKRYIARELYHTLRADLTALRPGACGAQGQSPAPMPHSDRRRPCHPAGAPAGRGRRPWTGTTPAATPAAPLDVHGNVRGNSSSRQEGRQFGDLRRQLAAQIPDGGACLPWSHHEAQSFAAFRSSAAAAAALGEL